MQFCEGAYGREGIRHFLRDVLAMANAAVDGNRYIVTGVRFDQSGERQVDPIDAEDFSGKPYYEALVAEFIEPPINIKYKPVTVDGRSVGVYAIGDCRDQPYMMRIDYSERLRRGDAYTRVDNVAVKIGRRILFRMFDKRTTNFIGEDTIEVGFPGEAIQKKLRLPTVDMSQLPSEVQYAKLNQLADVRENAKDSGSTTTLARMVHMRLFGSDDPYEDRTPTTLLSEMEEIRKKHEADDHRFLFDENAQKLQLVFLNNGDEPIQNASITLLMPNHDAFYAATSLTAPGNVIEFADYPTVSTRRNKIVVSSTVGEIPVGVPIEAFELPMRYCAGAEMDGKRMTLLYKLFGSNLQQPVEGRLSLAFQSTERSQQQTPSTG